MNQFPFTVGRIVVCLLVALLSSATIVPSQEAEDLELADKQAQEAYTKLMGTTDYLAMVSLIQSLKTNLVGLVRESFVDALITGMRSKKQLELKAYGTMTVLSRVNAGTMKGNTDGPVLKQDVFIEGGRCAWASEQLLNCELPPITEQSTHNDFLRTAYEVWYRVLEAKVPQDKRIDTSALSAEERLKLASSAETHILALARLAKDPEVAVRKAVATNRGTAFNTLTYLRDNDPEPEVRAAAFKNLEFARTHTDP